jgi:alkylation response protein AidB-like acyl-CoA dehydrogenase
VTPVYFDFSPEQQEFRSSLRKLVSDRAPLSAVRARLGDAHDADLWRTLCAEQAVTALAVPERYCGAGYTLEETAIAVAELGRGLAPVPVFEAVLAIEAILRLGTEAQREELLPALISGDRIAVVAATGPDDLTPAAGPMSATVVASTGVASTGVASTGGTACTLTGSRPQVLRGHVADLFLVPAAGPEGPGLYLVDSGAPGVSVSGRERSFDPTRPVSALELTTAPAVRLGPAAGTDAGGLLDVARTLLAAGMTAAAQACLDMSVAYAKQRVQFNRPIGSFQAIKHGCAELAVEVDAAQAACDWAVMLAAAGDKDLGTAALIAKAQAADTFAACAAWNIQVHGGIGFTWEHDAHLYLRRAKSDQVLFGDSALHRALLADRAGI